MPVTYKRHTLHSLPAVKDKFMTIRRNRGSFYTHLCDIDAFHKHTVNLFIYKRVQQKQNFLKLDQPEDLDWSMEWTAITNITLVGI